MILSQINHVIRILPDVPCHFTDQELDIVMSELEQTSDDISIELFQLVVPFKKLLGARILNNLRVNFD